MAVGQNQWYHSGVGAPPILVYFSGDWDVHWGTGFDPWPHALKQKAGKPGNMSEVTRASLVPPEHFGHPTYLSFPTLPKNINNMTARLLGGHTPRRLRILQTV